jgi:hypothetical protein
VVANLYWRPPTDQQLSAWRGMKTLDDFPEPVTEVWHENAEIVRWFRSMMSQFQYTGHGGGIAAMGFNYAVAYRDFDDMGLTGTTRDEWKWKMKVLEAAALSHINKAT